MEYIGFYLSMIGLAAAGGAIETSGSMIGALAMMIAGAVLMWLYREEDMDKKQEEERGGADADGA